ncbi:MAG: GNAT family N-acetyltransferase [Candidatus Acidiferrales bacterium]
MDALMGDELQTRWAVAGDVDAIARVVNAAFRRAESFFVERDRIDVAALRRMMLTGKFLLGEERGELLGCVYLELRGERAYFGLLAVDPARQRKGLGRRLICEVEDAARRAGCRFMDIQIVNLRAELPPFYRGLGYVETGTAPFPAEVVTKEKCYFIVMSKPLV